MALLESRQMIVALDIGTSKVTVLVAEITVDQSIKVIGVGTSPSHGLRKGLVIDIEMTVRSIQKALEQAESLADCHVHSAFISLGDSYTDSFNSHGIVAIKSGEVSHEDLERVLEAAQALSIPSDRRLLHVIPQSYIIDNQENIQDPIGMSGVRLEVKVHVITSAVNTIQNIEKCVSRCGLGVEDIILGQLASASSVLTEDEKKLGICLLDIGGGTTGVAIFTEGAIRHTAVIPIAGDQVTNDIAVALKITTQQAEEVKNRYACAMAKTVELSEIIKVPDSAGRTSREISRQELAEVVQLRYEELFFLIKSELKNSCYENLIPLGIVITGGSSQMEGLIKLAEEEFNMPIRRGTPDKIENFSEVIANPSYSSAVGLLQFGLNNSSPGSKPLKLDKNFNFMESLPVLARLKHWIQSNF